MDAVLFSFPFLSSYQAKRTLERKNRALNAFAPPSLSTDAATITDLSYTVATTCRIPSLDCRVATHYHNDRLSISYRFNGKYYAIGYKMSSAQDPFYIVKEEIQESIDKLRSTFHQWEHIPLDSGEKLHLTKDLLTGCESIEWQVDELDKTIAVAARDPAWYGIDELELDKRRRWTSTARTQVGNVKKAVTAGKELNGTSTSSINGMRRELMRLPNSHHTDRSNQYIDQDNDNFISSESDRQLLLIKQQDEELDELSASVERIGGVGLTIHEELLAQEKIIDELGLEMDNTSNRLDFVQKKVAMVMKKAGAKGQIMMILFLVVLFIVLFVLVFFT